MAAGTAQLAGALLLASVAWSTPLSAQNPSERFQIPAAHTDVGPRINGVLDEGWTRAAVIDDFVLWRQKIS